jgi:hypothetical protein
VTRRGAGNSQVPLRTGDRLDLAVTFAASREIDPVDLTLQFWNAAGILVASIESRILSTPLRLLPGTGQIRAELAFLPLTAGLYRVAAGFAQHGQLLAYARDTLEIHIADGDYESSAGMLVLDARLQQED